MQSKTSIKNAILKMGGKPGNHEDLIKAKEAIRDRSMPEPQEEEREYVFLPDRRYQQDVIKNTCFGTLILTDPTTNMVTAEIPAMSPASQVNIDSVVPNHAISDFCVQQCMMLNIYPDQFAGFFKKNPAANMSRPQAGSKVRMDYAKTFHHYRQTHRPMVHPKPRLNQMDAIMQMTALQPTINFEIFTDDNNGYKRFAAGCERVNLRLDKARDYYEVWVYKGSQGDHCVVVGQPPLATLTGPDGQPWLVRPDELDQPERPEPKEAQSEQPARGSQAEEVKSDDPIIRDEPDRQAQQPMQPQANPPRVEPNVLPPVNPIELQGVQQAAQQAQQARQEPVRGPEAPENVVLPPDRRQQNPGLERREGPERGIERPAQNCVEEPLYRYRFGHGRILFFPIRFVLNDDQEARIRGEQLLGMTRREFTDMMREQVGDPREHGHGFCRLAVDILAVKSYHLLALQGVSTLVTIGSKFRKEVAAIPSSFREIIAFRPYDQTSDVQYIHENASRATELAAGAKMQLVVMKEFVNGATRVEAGAPILAIDVAYYRGVRDFINNHVAEHGVKAVVIMLVYPRKPGHYYGIQNASGKPEFHAVIAPSEETGELYVKHMSEGNARAYNHPVPEWASSEEDMRFPVGETTVTWGIIDKIRVGNANSPVFLVRYLVHNVSTQEQEPVPVLVEDKGRVLRKYKVQMAKLKEKLDATDWGRLLHMLTNSSTTSYSADVMDVEIAAPEAWVTTMTGMFANFQKAGTMLVQYHQSRVKSALVTMSQSWALQERVDSKDHEDRILLDRACHAAAITALQERVGMAVLNNAVAIQAQVEVADSEQDPALRLLDKVNNYTLAASAISFVGFAGWGLGLIEGKYTGTAIALATGIKAMGYAVGKWLEVFCVRRASPEEKARAQAQLQMVYHSCFVEVGFFAVVFASNWLRPTIGGLTETQMHQLVETMTKEQLLQVTKTLIQQAHTQTDRGTRSLAHHMITLGFKASRGLAGALDTGVRQVGRLQSTLIEAQVDSQRRWLLIGACVAGMGAFFLLGRQGQQAVQKASVQLVRTAQHSARLVSTPGTASVLFKLAAAVGVSYLAYKILDRMPTGMPEHVTPITFITPSIGSLAMMEDVTNGKYQAARHMGYDNPAPIDFAAANNKLQIHKILDQWGNRLPTLIEANHPSLVENCDCHRQHMHRLGLELTSFSGDPVVAYHTGTCRTNNIFRTTVYRQAGCLVDPEPRMVRDFLAYSMTHVAASVDPVIFSPEDTTDIATHIATKVEPKKRKAYFKALGELTTGFMPHPFKHVYDLEPKGKELKYAFTGELQDIRARLLANPRGALKLLGLTARDLLTKLTRGVPNIVTGVNAAGMLEKLRELCPPTADRVVVIDGSAFDSSQHLSLMDLDAWFVRRYAGEILHCEEWPEHFHHEMIESLATSVYEVRAYHDRAKRKLSFSATLNGTTASGTPRTSLGNNLRVYCYQKYVLHLAGLDRDPRVQSANSGDDALFFCDQETEARILAAMNRAYSTENVVRQHGLGQVLKECKTYPLSGFPFCSKTISFNGEGLIGRNLTKYVPSTHFSSKEDELLATSKLTKHQQIVSNKVAGLIFSNPGDPLAEQIVANYQHNFVVGPATKEYMESKDVQARIAEKKGTPNDWYEAHASVTGQGVNAIAELTAGFASETTKIPVPAWSIGTAAANKTAPASSPPIPNMEKKTVTTVVPYKGPKKPKNKKRPNPANVNQAQVVQLLMSMLQQGKTQQQNKKKGPKPLNQDMQMSRLTENQTAMEKYMACILHPQQYMARVPSPFPMASNLQRSEIRINVQSDASGGSVVYFAPGNSFTGSGLGNWALACQSVNTVLLDAGIAPFASANQAYMPGYQANWWTLTGGTYFETARLVAAEVTIEVVGADLTQSGYYTAAQFHSGYDETWVVSQVGIDNSPTMTEGRAQGATIRAIWTPRDALDVTFGSRAMPPGVLLTSMASGLFVCRFRQLPNNVNFATARGVMVYETLPRTSVSNLFPTETGPSGTTAATSAVADKHVITTNSTKLHGAADRIIHALNTPVAQLAKQYVLPRIGNVALGLAEQILAKLS